MKNSDVELIHRILDGDETAFSILVEKYQRQVHALAWRKIGDFHIAEEITQDTFLKAYQKLATLKKPHRFAGWLYVIATRRCQAWLRKKQVQTESLEEIDSEELEPEAYSQYVAEEEAKATVEAQREVVKKLLATLPESERTVITLHYFGEMTVEEISKFLGVSAGTIKSRLQRARQRLQKEETMIREALDHFQISPNLTENIMKEITRLKPATPVTSKPFVPWIIGASSLALIVLMLGIGSQDLARFQKPYSLDAQTETTIELVDTPIVQNVDTKPDVRNQAGNRSDIGNKNDGNGQESNQVLGDEGDWTRWNLPEGARQRLGKGILNDMQLSPDGNRLAIASSIGVWLYDVSTSDETPLLTKSIDSVNLVAFSPDGKTLVSAEGGNTIRSWEVNSGKPLLTFNNPGGSLSSLKFLADGETLVAVSWDGKVQFWNITTGKHLKTFDPGAIEVKIKNKTWQRAVDAFVDRIGVVTFAIGNADGTISIKNGQIGKEIRKLTPRTNDTDFFIISDSLKPPRVRVPIVKRQPAGRRSPFIRDPAEDPKEYHTIYRDDGTPFPIQYQLGHLSRLIPSLDEQPMKWMRELNFSADGKTLVSKSEYRTINRDGWGGQSGPIEIWDVDTGEQLAALRSSRVSDVKFSGDGKTLAIIGIAGCVIWDVDTRSEIASFPQGVDVRFSGDGKTVAIVERERYMMWDIATRREITSLDFVQEQFERIMLSQDGTLLTTTDVKGKVSVWETKTNAAFRTLTTGYTKNFLALAFSHDGKTLASGDDAGNIQLWDTDTRTKRLTIKAGSNHIGELAFTTDNATLISASRGDLIEWSVATGEQIAAHIIPKGAASSGGTLTFNDRTGFRLKASVFTPNSKTFATRRSKSEHSIYEIWDITSDHLQQRPIEIRYQWGPIALAPDGNTFVSSNHRNAIIFLWDAHTSNQLATLKISNAVCAIRFSPDGKTLIVGTGNKEIQLWDLATYQQIGTLEAHEHAICELAFSPDRTLLASGDTGGKIHLWEFSTRRHLATFEGHKKDVRALAFTPDGKTLASISGSGYNNYQGQGSTIILWDVPSK